MGDSIYPPKGAARTGADQPAGAPQASGKTIAQSGTGAAYRLLILVLALEPPLRAAIWWSSGSRLRPFLDADLDLLAVAVVALLVGSVTHQVRHQITRHKWLCGLFGVWIIAAAASSIAATMPDVAIYRSYIWLLHLLFALYVLAALRALPEAGPALLLSWCIGFCGYALVVGAYIIADPVRAVDDWVWSIPGHANIRHLGFEAMAAGLIGVLFRPASASWLSIWLLRATAILGWAVVFWSGSRGSFLGGLAALILVALLSDVSELKRRAIEVLMLFGAAFALATLHAPANASLGAWRTIGLTQDTTESRDPSSGRKGIWEEAVEVILENPFFGIGEAQTKVRLVSALGQFSQPHNLVLQVLLAWGFLGGGAFLIGLAFATLRAVRRVWGAAVGSPAMSGLAVAIGLLAGSMVDASLYRPRLVILFLLGLSVALSSSLSERVKTGLSSRQIS